MEETVLVQPRSGLIVDRSEDTREVLTTALERRGLKILSASGPRRGLRLAREHHPDLIVLDLEADGGEADEVCAPFAEQSRASQATLVVLGSIRRDFHHPPAGEFIPKPYHYGPLIRRIEQLLIGTGRGSARRV
jgi:DNA-binding response OmpR family regulator